MGFNKRIINFEKSLIALQNEKLNEYYCKSDSLFFEDTKSFEIYELYISGKTDEEILKLINKINGR